MSDSVYVGMRAGGLETSPAFEPISKIVIYVDDENAYEAGNDTGRTMEVTCPYGTQEMANNLLDQLGGYTYQPAQATDALMDPAAELGDAVTIGGVYTTLASVTTAWDRLMTADIGAPGQDEIDSEYPYISRQTSQINYQLATLRSQISQTSEAITLRVGRLENQYAQQQVTIDGVTVSGPGGTTLIKGSSIQTSTLAANSISASAVNLTGAITFGDLSASVQNDINDAYSLAQSADNAAADANDRIEAWSYNGGTYIDGTMLATNTVTASTIRGGTVQLLSSSGSVSGSLSLSPATTSAYAIDLTSNAAMRLVASSGLLYLEGNPRVAVSCSTFHPMGAAPDLGSPSYGMWQEVFAYTGEINTSDANLKYDIEALPDSYVTMLDNITPVRYKMRNGTWGRYHVGFIAQDVEQAMQAAGITDMDFAGWCQDVDEEGENIYLLRYQEFIALLWAKIRQLESRLPAEETKEDI